MIFNSISSMLRRHILHTGFLILLLAAGGCDSDGGGGGSGGGGGGGILVPPAEVPQDNKQAEIVLTVGPNGFNKYLLVVGVTDVVPGTTVKQSNAQNTLTGKVGEAGVYQREHFTYAAGVGEVSVIVTLTDPEGEVLIREVKKEIPGPAPAELAP